MRLQLTAGDRKILVLYINMYICINMGTMHARISPGPKIMEYSITHGYL